MKNKTMTITGTILLIIVLVPTFVLMHYDANMWGIVGCLCLAAFIFFVMAYKWTEPDPDELNEETMHDSTTDNTEQRRINESWPWNLIDKYND